MYKVSILLIMIYQYNYINKNSENFTHDVQMMYKMYGENKQTDMYPFFYKIEMYIIKIKIRKKSIICIYSPFKIILLKGYYVTIVTKVKKKSELHILQILYFHVYQFLLNEEKLYYVNILFHGFVKVCIQVYKKLQICLKKKLWFTFTQNSMQFENP